MRKALFERFENKYAVDTKSGCWIWHGATSSNGYGHMKMDRRSVKATHVSLMLIGVKIPEGYYVCHHCDTPQCVNPEHLFLGTQADNLNDMRAKKRRPTEYKKSVECGPDHRKGDNLYVAPSGQRQCRACMARAKKARTFVRVAA